MPPHRSGTARGGGASAPALAVVIAVAMAVVIACCVVGVVAETEVDYTYTCPGSAPVTKKIAVMACGCLAERQQLTRVLDCAQSEQFAVALAACRTCAQRSDCNCSAPAEVRRGAVQRWWGRASRSPRCSLQVCQNAFVGAV